MDKSIHSGNFYSDWGPILRLAYTSEMHCCKISWLWPPTVCSIFTAIHAKYKHLDTSIPVLQQLQPWIDTFVQLIEKNIKSSFLINVSVFFLLCWPCSPPWPRMPLWYIVWSCKKYLLTKGYAGSRGGTHSKINYKALNETPNARSQQFFENQLSMRSHTKSVCSIW